VLREHIFNIREFYAVPSEGNLKRAVEHLYRHPETFGRIYIAARLLKMFHENSPFIDLTEQQRRFLTIAKLWDFQRTLRDPIGEVDELVQGLLRRL